MEPLPEKPKKLAITNPASTGDRFLDACLEVIERIGSGKDVSRYVNSLAGKSKLMREQALSLVDKGVLEAREQSFLVFSWTNFPEADSAPKAALVARITDAISGEVELEAEDCAVIALADKTELLKKNFDKKLLSTHKRRIKDISKGAVGPTKATLKAIDAVMASLVAVTAVTAATAATS